MKNFQEDYIKHFVDSRLIRDCNLSNIIKANCYDTLIKIISDIFEEPICLEGDPIRFVENYFQVMELDVQNELMEESVIKIVKDAIATITEILNVKAKGVCFLLDELVINKTQVAECINTIKLFLGKSKFQYGALEGMSPDRKIYLDFDSTFYSLHFDSETGVFLKWNKGGMANPYFSPKSLFGITHLIPISEYIEKGVTKAQILAYNKFLGTKLDIGQFVNLSAEIEANKETWGGQVADFGVKPLFDCAITQGKREDEFVLISVHWMIWCYLSKNTINIKRIDDTKIETLGDMANHTKRIPLKFL